MSRIPLGAPVGCSGGRPLSGRAPRCALLPAALLALVLLGACARQPVLPDTFKASDFRGFVVARPLLPFRAEGSALLTLAGRRETGEMVLEGDAGPRYRILLKARITGALAAEVRFDPERLLVVDYVNSRFHQGPNTPPVRRKLFELDMESGDFQTLITGRVERARFEQGGGWRNGDRAGFTSGQVRHEFSLGANGLPVAWVKSRGDVSVFRVEFREYAPLAVPGGAPLQMPRKVRLNSPEGGRLVLGIRAVHPGEGHAPSPGELPEGARAFASDLLSAMP